MNLEHLNISIEVIDKQNLICYDAIADEYGNDSHETCRDFDSGTYCFLEKAVKFDELIELSNKFNYLDVGVGTGVSLEFLLPLLNEKSAEIDVLDISSQMLSICKEKFGGRIDNYFETSIHAFQNAKKYDLIVGSLCDPFLTNQALSVLKQCLTKNGVLLITIPANTWAKKVRKENITQTVFHNKKREKYLSYSFCWSKGDLIKYAEQNGFFMKYCNVILIDEIKKRKSLSKLNSSLTLTENKVPMLLTMMLFNKNS